MALQSFSEIYWRFSWGFREFVTVGGRKGVKDGLRNAIRAFPRGRCNLQSSRSGTKHIAWKMMVTATTLITTSAPAASVGAAQRSARHGEQLRCNRAEPMPELAR